MFAHWYFHCQSAVIFNLSRDADDAVVRALTSHQLIPGSIPGPGIICGLNLLFGSLLCSERFFSGYSGFPRFSWKTNISKFQFDSGMHWHFSTSSCKLLGAPWVNKLHFFCTDWWWSYQGHNQTEAEREWCCMPSCSRPTWQWRGINLWTGSYYTDKGRLTGAKVISQRRCF